MPQVNGAKSDGKSALRKSTSNDAHDLLSTMIDYEAAAKLRGMDLAAGRFEMLTASERQFYRAELIADYIKLSAENLGRAHGYFTARLDSFCSKICEMGIPSHELAGTYLAAVEIAANEEPLKDIPRLADAIRRTMIVVMQKCCEKMSKKSALAGVSR